MASKETKTLSFKEQIILEQVRRHYAATKSAFDTSERKAQMILSLSSVAITIITGFRIVSPQTGQYTGLFLVLVFYLLIIVLAFIALLPGDRRSEPIPANWQAIQENLQMSDDDFLDSLLGAYEDAVTHNKKINLFKSRLVTSSLVLMFGMIVAALITALGT